MRLSNKRSSFWLPRASNTLQVFRTCSVVVEGPNGEDGRNEDNSGFFKVRNTGSVVEKPPLRKRHSQID